MSSLTTGGLLNPVLAAAEAFAAFVVSVTAILIPIVAALLGVVLVVYALRRRARGEQPARA